MILPAIVRGLVEMARWVGRGYRWVQDRRAPRVIITEERRREFLTRR